MAHIANCLFDSSTGLGLNNYIARELSPHPPYESKPKTPPPETPATEEREKFVWRMHQPSETRKYLTFSKEKLSIMAGRKSPDSESTLSLGQGGSSEKDRSMRVAGLRLKSKDQPTIRTGRRKISVPELGPMTTVQEIAMDSPTIPGRPPVHERSISAPGNSWRQNPFGENMVRCITGPSLEEHSEKIPLSNTLSNTKIQTGDNTRSRPLGSVPAPTRRPGSPRSLMPLIIPSSSAPKPRLAQQGSRNEIELDDETPGPDVPPKSARLLLELKGSPSTAPVSTPQTSLTSAPITSTPLSSVPQPTPFSAPVNRSSPQPWSASPVTHTRCNSETSSRTEQHPCHRRGESEGGSIMDRGRPKKRLISSPLRTEEREACEALPQGTKPSDVMSLLPAIEIDLLRRQAVGQASQFEVLNSKDVDALSRELRSLDERCEYLRKTHRNLRSGRRNLHQRICSSLRSPRTARFSNESILKQEEALAELDASIDSWVSKLEQAENRRIRVRQKLLEHVAAALIVQAPAAQEKMSAAMQSIQMGMRGQDTPPHSPTKSQSPTRLPTPPEEVSPQSPVPVARGDVESIRIYADPGVYALLADIEDEIKDLQKGKERKLSFETENAIEAGITLNPVAFEGLVGNHARSQTC